MLLPTALRKSWIPSDIYLLKVNNRNTKTKCEICSKLTIKTPERRCWRPSAVFIANFENISHLVLVCMYVCKIYLTSVKNNVTIVNFEHVIAG